VFLQKYEHASARAVPVATDPREVSTKEASTRSTSRSSIASGLFEASGGGEEEEEGEIMFVQSIAMKSKGHAGDQEKVHSLFVELCERVKENNCDGVVEDRLPKYETVKKWITIFSR
jgi:hypothetical protein